jgi:hypothetical protein
MWRAAGALAAGFLLFFVHAPAVAARMSTAVCASIKAKAAGARVARSLGCYAAAIRGGSGTPVGCLANAQKKFARAFAKADKKGSCGVAGDATLVGDSATAFAEGIAAGLFPAGAADVGRRCASGKMRRAGVYGKGRLACWGHAFRATRTLDPSCVAARATRLETIFAKLETKGNCPTTSDEPSVAQAVSGFVDAVAGVLMPAAPTTTSTTSTTVSGATSSTTTTMPAGSTTTTLAGGTTTTTAPGATTTTSTLPTVVRLSLHVQPIFTANCAVAGCHAGVMPAEGMDLRSGHTHGSIVDVASQECPLFKRVRPGAPTQSSLVFKLNGPPQPCFSGNQMPSGGAPPLSAADQLLIRTWIEQGALDN